MRLARGRGVLVAWLFLLVAGNAFAQYEVGIAVPNWTVPAYRTMDTSGGLSTMADISPGIAFVAMSPCRVFDTRNANGPYGGPRLLANTTRNFDIDNGPCTGIPALPEAYSMNFGAILPDGANSFVTIWPTGTAQPVVSSINPIQGGVVANAAIVPAGVGGSISVFPNTGLHLYGDINGYFTDRYNPGVSFHAVSSTPAPAILAENTSSASEAVAIQGVITTTTPGPTGVAAVKGFNQGTNNTGVGVWGKHNGGGWGVLGESATGFGVVATAGGTGSNAAVYARNASAGVASGVFGWANSAGVRNYGIQGWTDSTALGAAGVFGQDGFGAAAPANYSGAGVRGESNFGIGVFGVIGPTGADAVRGQIHGGPAGVLGSQGGSNDYGVLSLGNAYVSGNLTVTGTIGAPMTAFVQPHPFDASKQIRYVALEAPRSEVYFRGTSQVSQGVTRIPVPEDFRLVAQPGTYSTLVTPVGAMATVAVMAQGEDGIVIQASRNVKVAYVVYAEREAMRNPDPIVENTDFRPDPNGELLTGLPESYRRLMIQNGSLNPDGTVNMETARRLGWDKEWEKRERPAPQPTPE